MSGIRTRHYAFDDFRAAMARDDASGIRAREAMRLYDEARRRDAPTILELGTQNGSSTTYFLQAVHENGGKLVSVDIDPACAEVSDQPAWQFVASESTAAGQIAEQAPILKDGIDILLIDSWHWAPHVEREFWAWEPYLNEGALVIFDDVDSHQYRQGGPKEGWFSEFQWEEIRQLVEDIFFANEGVMSLQIQFGGTGFAYLTKYAPRDHRLKRPTLGPRRTQSCYWRAYIGLERWWMNITGRRRNPYK